MSKNSFNARKNLDVAGKSFEIFDISQIEGASNLPFSLKVLLENLLRTEITSMHWLPGIQL
jgi:aconitate hydratase